MIFALPLLALGCGLALAMLLGAVQSRQEKAASENTTVLPKLRYAEWAVVGLVALFAVYFISVGSYTWFVRVINYVLPAGTG